MARFPKTDHATPMTEIAYLAPRSGATYPLAVPRRCGDGPPLMPPPLPGRHHARRDPHGESLALALEFLPSFALPMLVIRG